jgi:hypothetical protein
LGICLDDATTDSTRIAGEFLGDVHTYHWLPYVTNTVSSRAENLKVVREMLISLELDFDQRPSGTPLSATMPPHNRGLEGHKFSRGKGILCGARGPRVRPSPLCLVGYIPVTETAEEGFV